MQFLLTLKAVDPQSSLQLVWWSIYVILPLDISIIMYIVMHSIHTYHVHLYIRTVAWLFVTTMTVLELQHLYLSMPLYQDTNVESNDVSMFFSSIKI